MNFVPKKTFLELKPDTIQYVRKQYNMDKPGIIEEAVSILKEWIQKQSHFNKKDFSDKYLERTIVVCKGSIERAKSQLDKMCTLRTLVPQFFGNGLVKEDYDQYAKILKSVVLPKLTPDHYRVHITKYYDAEWETSQAIHYYRQTRYLAEFIKAHDYLSGFVIVADFSDANIMNFLPRINLFDIKQTMTILMREIHMRVKEVIVISNSNFVGTAVTFMKQLVSPKVGNRIKVYQSKEDLQKYIPKDILPKDYGGDERSMDTLQEEWNEVLSSEEYLKYLREMNVATTNESCRPKDQFSEQYAGIPGTFRYLTVD